MLLSEADQYAATHSALEQRRARAVASEFNIDDYLFALENSALSKSEKNTVRMTAETVNPDGFTSVDRMTVAMGTGQVETTVTRHWKSARSQGLLDDRRRFNSTSVQVATVPGSGHGFPANWVTSTPIDGYFWNKEMTDWWASDAASDQRETPWGDGPPPF